MATIVSAPSPFKFFYDKDGNPLSGGRLYTYYAGTSVLRETYTNADASTINTNPIVLNDGGMCVLFVGADDEDTTDSDAKSGYRFMLYDKKGVLISDEDNIFAIKGKNGTNTGIIKYGPAGIQGVAGKSIRGPQGKKGDVGPTSDNGTEYHFWRQAGTYNYTVPDDVYQINYRVGGGGGGFYIEKTLPDLDNVGTGIAGTVVRGTINVNPGDILVLNIGAGGLATTDQNSANGKSSSISGTTISTVTAVGGTSGNTANLSNTQSYYQKLMPKFTETIFSGSSINIIPDAIYGESSEFGEGGNIYKNGTADAVGNCSSGGTDIPFVNTSGKVQISTYGKGGDGIVELSFVRTSIE